MSEIDWAYLAGLLDGEATFGAYRSKRKSGSGAYQRYVSISNTNQDIVRWFAKVCGCGYTQTVKQTKTQKAQLRHTIVGNRATWLCHNLLPYLRIKKRHARLMLQLAGLQKRGNKRTYFPRKGQKCKDTAKQDVIFTKLKALNHRGIKAQ